MKIREKFYALTRQKQIGVVVVLLHSLVVFGLLIDHFIQFMTRPKQPILVRTTELVVAPQKKVVAPAPAKPKVKPTAAPAPVPKKEKAKVEPKKKPDPAPLVDEIVKNLDAFTAPEKKVTPKKELVIPQKMESKIDAKIEAQSADYGEFLVAYLQSTLDLPEMGEVKAKLQIDCFGKLLDFEILSAKSRKNGDFLKNRLPELTFPCFNDFGIKNSQVTLTITFRNVEIR
jgi:hypothetical protein